MSPLFNINPRCHGEVQPSLPPHPCPSCLLCCGQSGVTSTGGDPHRATSGTKLAGPSPNKRPWLVLHNASSGPATQTLVLKGPEPHLPAGLKWPLVRGQDCPLLIFCTIFYAFIFFLMPLTHVQGKILALVHDTLMKNSDTLPWGTLLHSRLPHRKRSSFLKGWFSSWLMNRAYNKENVLWILTKSLSSSLSSNYSTLQEGRAPFSQGWCSWPHVATKYGVNLNISGNLALDVDDSPFREIPELGLPLCSSKSSEGF